MRLESVSWKPSETAMPPTPRAAITELVLTPKQLSSTMLAPTIQMMARTMLMMMLELGSGLLPWCSMRVAALTVSFSTTRVAITMMTAHTTCWKSGWVTTA